MAIKPGFVVCLPCAVFVTVTDIPMTNPPVREEKTNAKRDHGGLLGTNGKNGGFGFPSVIGLLILVFDVPGQCRGHRPKLL